MYLSLVQRIPHTGIDQRCHTGRGQAFLTVAEHSMSESQNLFNKAQNPDPWRCQLPRQSLQRRRRLSGFSATDRVPISLMKTANATLITLDHGVPCFGTSHLAILGALQNQMERGVGFRGSPRLEVEMAELVCQLVPSIEQVRMVNSGTEATMSAIRLARGFTGRDKILKFEGCYHGHADALWSKLAQVPQPWVFPVHRVYRPAWQNIPLPFPTIELMKSGNCSPAKVTRLPPLS